MNMLKDIASLSVMKPRCEELGKRKIVFLLILASVGEKSRLKTLFQVGQRWDVCNLTTDLYSLYPTVKLKSIFMGLSFSGCQQNGIDQAY